MRVASWLNVVLGAWLMISPWVIGYAAGSAVMEDVILGIAVLVVALWAIGSTATAPSRINIVLGVWILIAPWVIGYAGIATGAMWNDVVVGILVALVAVAAASARPVITAGPGTRY
jgi:hypothetical protein